MDVDNFVFNNAIAQKKAAGAKIFTLSRTLRT